MRIWPRDLYLHAESRGAEERPIGPARGIIIAAMTGAICWTVVLGLIAVYWRSR